MKHIRLRVALLLAFATLFLITYAADSDSIMNYRFPLDVTMSLSGNYGELRTNHFHGGIDYRVGGVVGAHIFAAEDGYISRISISPSGYGKAIYITHPNGELSVYGHLENFAPIIKEYILERQYSSESFNQDITFNPDDFVVEKGDLIGYAGNTGNSGGPHLHFEIRDASNQTMDIIERDIINVKGESSVKLNNVVFYGLNKHKGVYRSAYVAQSVSRKGVINVPDEFYVAIDAVGRLEGTYAKLAIKEYNVFLDDNLIFEFNVGEIPFSLNRYINSITEPRQRVMKKRHLVRTFIEEGNLLKDRIYADNNGIIEITDTLRHKVRVEVSDYAGKKDVATFFVKRDSLLTKELFEKDSIGGYFTPWFLPNFHEFNGLQIDVPQAALYSSIYLDADTLLQRVSPFAPVWRVGNPLISMHKYVNIIMDCSVPAGVDHTKITLAKIGEKGELSYVGGNYNPSLGQIEGRIYSFGDYTVVMDTIPPTITPSFKNNSVLKKNIISFTVEDDLSGIKKYRVEIDGKWVLAEYDLKNNKINVPLLDSRIERGGGHKIEVFTIDMLYNEAILTSNFIW